MPDESPSFGTPRGRARKVLVRLAIGLALLVTLPLAVVWFMMVRMPGKSAPRAMPALTAEEAAVADRLRASIGELGGRIGARNLDHPKQLIEAAAFVQRELEAVGYTVARESFTVKDMGCDNLVAEIKGTSRAEEIVLVGAHYDSEYEAPGANDNGSGVAGLLEIARRMFGHPTARTVRFVVFTNEEPPYFRKVGQMGSRVNAANAKARGDRIVGMLSLETMGYFSDVTGTQQYPFPFSLFYPDRGDFIGFVTALDAADFARETIGYFREQGTVPSEGGALPARLPGVGWSDHESYYQLGIPAVMITDTAPFRYPHYHTREDLPDKIDYSRLARVVVGLGHVVERLAAGK